MKTKNDCLKPNQINKEAVLASTGIPRSMVNIEVNANFHILKKDRQKKNDQKFAEYRRRWTGWPENFFVGNFPLFIDIEVTSICNLRCPFCATTYRNELITKGFITFELVKKIIDEGADHGLYGVKFNYRGEPLLHKDISNFVKYAKQKGLIDVYFNTNGMLLNNEMIRALIDAGLDRISISIEGFTKEVYERNRVGGDFEKLLVNIVALQKEKEKMGVDWPRVRVQSVLLEELKDNLGAYESFWKGIADEVAYLDFKEMKARRKGICFPWACPQLWQRMQVWWDGTIVPCNHDDEAGIKLGNIKHMSIKEAWQSEFLEKVREKHKRGLAHEVPSCDGCYLRDSEIRKIVSDAS